MSSVRNLIVETVVALLGLLTIATSQGVAQTDGDGGGALGDTIVDAFQELLEVLFRPIETVIENHGDAVLRTVVGTPHPNAVFNQPTNGAWPEIYHYYWQTMLPLSLSLYGLSIGLVILLESTSHLFSGYHRSKLKKRAFAGLLGVLSWWWIAALSLRFIDALAGFLVPSVSEISLFQTLSFSTMGVLGTVIALSANFVLFVLIGLIYLARHLALYLFVFLMPLLIVFWIPGVGPFALVSRFVKRLAGFYVPFLFMTVPVALLFRLGDILGTSFGFSAGEFGAWLTALVIPLAAVTAPLILFWQAGALFFIADRATRYVSRQRVRDRVVKGRDHLRAARHGGRNFLRGIRDKPAVTADGQYLLNSGNSRAHGAGQRINATGSRPGSVFENDGSNRGRHGGSSGSSDSRTGDEAKGGNRRAGYDRSVHDDLRDARSGREHRNSTDETSNTATDDQ